MKRLFLHLIIILVVLAWTSVQVCAQSSATEQSATPTSDEAVEAPVDSIRFSLLTCSPGTEVYALFGHTAIRYEDFTLGFDVIFNYGMFNFQTPHFVYRFLKGETDYELGTMPYYFFKEEYAERGSYVEQQELNLTSDEKLHLLAILNKNSMPANRVYRYNYFYDNCSTRARDRIEEVIVGTVNYPTDSTPRSFRKIIHEFTAGHPWAEFGIDFLLGAEADEAISERMQMFAPFYMLQAVDSARIIGPDGTVRPLVLKRSRIINPQAREVEEEFPLTPMQLSLGLLLLVVLISVVEIKWKRSFWGVDVLLFAAQGLAGCIVAFLFFFSIHPTVGSNYLIIPFNPLPLLYLPVLVCRRIKGKKDAYYTVSAVVLTLFIVLWPVIPQKINLAVLPLALSLLLRSVTHLWIVYRKRSK